MKKIKLELTEFQINALLDALDKKIECPFTSYAEMPEIDDIIKQIVNQK